jgi:hypothetical protein
MTQKENSMRLFEFALALGLLMQLSVALCQEQVVTPKEIQDKWVDKTLVGTTSGGSAVTMKLRADGTASLNAGTTYDTGTWRASDEGYCTTWRKIRYGQESCFTAKRDASRVTVLNADGSISGYFTEVK